MALRAVYRLNSCINNSLPIIPCRLFHLSYLNGGTHSYALKLYQIPNEKFYDFVDKNPLLDIRKRSGAVVRFRETEIIDITEQKSRDLLVVGNTNQIQRAFEYLNKFLGDTQQIEIAEQDDRRKIKSTEQDVDDNKLMWHGYRRNFKGQFPPLKPRKKCIRCKGKKICGNPCPLCQMTLSSNYEIHFTDVEILNQFICQRTWNILEPSITGVCRIQHFQLVAAIQKARLSGYLPFTLPLPSETPRKHKPAGVPTDRKIKVKMH